MEDAALLRLSGLHKSFGSTPVLSGVTLSIRPGEFLTLLGPSGCGKTTTLRIISGLTQPDSGRVLLRGQDVTDWPPNKRDVNTVFQNYALFPHMNVAKNIAYGLTIRGVSRASARRRVSEMLELVQLPGYEKRMPDELSGGQRQRVAIARAVILEPKLLLLDEPLGALDLKLRQQMQGELKRIQQRLGIAFLYITHDQEEALNMSDRIAVMNAGRFEQIGTPEQIYERPRTRFVAEFIGQSARFDAEALSVTGEDAVLSVCGTRIPARAPDWLRPGMRALLCVHCERIEYGLTEGPMCLPATVVRHQYAGAVLSTTLELADGTSIVAAGRPHGMALPEPGARVCAHWQLRDAAIVDPAAGPLAPEEDA